MKLTTRRTVRLVEKPQSEGNWDRWFAWYPVKVARRDSVDWIWLEFVERKWSTRIYGSERKQRRYRMPVDSKPNVQQRLHNLTELAQKLDAALSREKAALRRDARNQLRPQRSVILGLLLTLAAAAWAGLIWHSHTTTEMTMMHAVGYARHFIADWLVMMVAMMLPTAVPMILAFHQVQAANRQPRDAFGSTWVFVVAYLAVWAFSGLAA